MAIELGDAAMNANGHRVARAAVGRPGFAAVIGLACAIPFLVLNSLVANGVAPARAFFRGVMSDDIWATNALGMAVFLGVVLLIAVGGIIALRPLAARGRRARGLWLNLVVGCVLLTGFAVLATALGREAYQCHVADVANCD